MTTTAVTTTAPFLPAGLPVLLATLGVLAALPDIVRVREHAP